MLNICFTSFPCLTTERLYLRNVTLGDADELFALHTDERVNEFLERPKPASIEEIHIYVIGLDTSMRDYESVTWAVTLKGDTKLIGTIFLWNIYKVDCRAEIGFELHPEFQGKGIMQEAFSKVLRFGFETMKLHSIEADVDPNNVKSIRFLQRNNFVQEGYFKECTYHKGKFRDRAVYSLIRHDESERINTGQEPDRQYIEQGT